MFLHYTHVEEQARAKTAARMDEILTGSGCRTLPLGFVMLPYSCAATMDSIRKGDTVIVLPKKKRAKVETNVGEFYGARVHLVRYERGGTEWVSRSQLIRADEALTSTSMTSARSRNGPADRVSIEGIIGKALAWTFAVLLAIGIGFPLLSALAGRHLDEGVCLPPPGRDCQ